MCKCQGNSVTPRPWLSSQKSLASLMRTDAKGDVGLREPLARALRELGDHKGAWWASRGKEGFAGSGDLQWIWLVNKRSLIYLEHGPRSKENRPLWGPLPKSISAIGHHPLQSRQPTAGDRRMNRPIDRPSLTQTKAKASSRLLTYHKKQLKRSRAVPFLSFRRKDYNDSLFYTRFLFLLW